MFLRDLRRDRSTSNQPEQYWPASGAMRLSNPSDSYNQYPEQGPDEAVSNRNPIGAIAPLGRQLYRNS
jgi:hypothetical protein